MNDAIIIEIEIINSFYGLGAKFWKGKTVLKDVPIKYTLDEMNRITTQYNSENKAVLFATK